MTEASARNTSTTNHGSRSSPAAHAPLELPARMEASARHVVSGCCVFPTEEHLCAEIIDYPNGLCGRMRLQQQCRYFPESNCRGSREREASSSLSSESGKNGGSRTASSAADPVFTSESSSLSAGSVLTPQGVPSDCRSSEITTADFYDSQATESACEDEPSVFEDAEEE
ncbi:hypothetical protein CORC01_12185 [Colletotrichum orchidophilum]|uniref:Uncharacterized protein n=1 Tax=Colletotrichum orchidophilum TaxID=1209926 RepID=A0A1G4ATW2_9PEZI|nr:uncharacterized protein CORC01_12185 [Colletotrichum orchidophilum]OHE92536.1 hypothetical protein CORC01_12185 [Colletotrichum orchidophilum]